MAAGDITPTEPAAIIEADATPRTLTLSQKFRRVSLLNLGPADVIIRTASGAFVNTDPATPVQEDGEAIIPSGNSFPLWTSLTSVQYRCAAAATAALVMAADTE